MEATALAIELSTAHAQHIISPGAGVGLHAGGARAIDGGVLQRFLLGRPQVLFPLPQHAFPGGLRPQCRGSVIVRERGAVAV